MNGVHVLSTIVHFHFTMSRVGLRRMLAADGHQREADDMKKRMKVVEVWELLTLNPCKTQNKCPQEIKALRDSQPYRPRSKASVHKVWHARFGCGWLGYLPSLLSVARKGLKGMEDKSFVNDLFEHMQEGKKIGYVNAAWWHANGLDDRIPCEIRVVTDIPEWSVRSRMATGGHHIRIMKTLYAVYCEFYDMAARAEAAKQDAFAASPWMAWDTHILHMRLVAARGLEPKRHTAIRRAKTHVSRERGGG